jgi:hypothetical protein
MAILHGGGTRKLIPPPPPRTPSGSITMATRHLTADDIADYTVTMAHGNDITTSTVRAAYVASEPGWLLFKDHEHREVARINEHLVLMVERRDVTGHSDGSDEDRIREAVAEAQDPGRVVTR